MAGDMSDAWKGGGGLPGDMVEASSTTTIQRDFAALVRKQVRRGTAHKLERHPLASLDTRSAVHAHSSGRACLCHLSPCLAPAVSQLAKF
ncbi:MAG: hypothetical protein ACJ8BW_05715 [Ktedonobacteraceae bacterium]